MTILPIHPHPQPDEILSSWMVRLAFSNGFPLHTFYSSLLEYKAPIWNRDIDRHPASHLLELLALRSGQTVTALHALTLKTYSGLLFEEYSPIGSAQWILPVGIFHRTRRRIGMQFCPLCLQNDRIPYYRRHWRTALSALCGQHECLMMASCPACYSPVAYHRHGIGRNKDIQANALRLCHHCGFNFCNATPTYLNWPDPPSWSKLCTLTNTFEQGGWDCGHVTLPCGVPFFQGLRILISVISGRNGKVLRQQLSQQFHLNIPDNVAGKHFEFEQLDVNKRLVLILTSLWLLEDWPTRFVDLCKATHFTRSRLVTDFKTIPFWLASIVDTFLDHRPYLLNDDEVISACLYLISKNREVSQDALQDLLRLPKDRRRAAWSVWEKYTRVESSTQHQQRIVCR